MKYTAFYIIRPKGELNLKLSDYDNLEFLKEPVLWTMKQGGHDGDAMAECVEAVKIFFLAQLKHSTLNINEYTGLFGSSIISSNLFDSWFDIEVFDGYDDSIEDVVGELNANRCVEELSYIENSIVKQMFQQIANKTKGKSGSNT